MANWPVGTRLRARVHFGLEVRGGDIVVVTMNRPIGNGFHSDHSIMNETRGNIQIGSDRWSLDPALGWELVEDVPADEYRFIVYNENTQSVLPLSNRDGGTRAGCLDQITRWFGNAARTAAQRNETVFHLVPLRSVGRVNINGPMEE